MYNTFVNIAISKFCSTFSKYYTIVINTPTTRVIIYLTMDKGSFLPTTETFFSHLNEYLTEAVGGFLQCVRFYHVKEFRNAHKAHEYSFTKLQKLFVESAWLAPVLQKFTKNTRMLAVRADIEGTQVTKDTLGH